MADNDAYQGAPRSPPGLGLGERLRSARKARALSVQQVAESLRLEESSVLALEDGRFEAMGAPVFVRGHLKRYALLVGLSPETVLEAYRAAAPDSDALPAIARPREQFDAVRLPSWVYWVAAGLILVGAIVALSSGGDDEPAAAPASAALPGAAPVATADSPAGPVAMAGAPPSAGAIRLTLELAEDSWVEIDDSERRVVYGLQRQGSRQEFEVKPPLLVMVGNARGVALALGGQALEIPAASITNNVARFAVPVAMPVPAPESAPAVAPVPPATPASAPAGN